MKRSELILMALQVPLDFVMLMLAGVAAYYTRFSEKAVAIRPLQFELELEPFMAIVTGFAITWIIIYAFSGLYKPDPNRKLATDFSKIILASSTGLAAITIFIFFRGEFFHSRFIVLAGWGYAMIFVFAGRIYMRSIRSILYQFGLAQKQVIIIGAQKIKDVISEAFNQRKSLGYHVLATYPSFSDSAQRKILKMHRSSRIDEIIFTSPQAQAEEALEIVEFCQSNHITFKYSADLFSTYVTNMSVSSIAGVPVVELKKIKMSGWGHIIKRSFDIVGSAVLIVIFAPIMILCGLAVAIGSAGPVIYRNERVGLNGKVFDTLKFRSMYAEFSTGKQNKNGKAALAYEKELIKKQNTKSGPLYKIENDPRITKVGAFLRFTSLDEFPQLFNVLLGSMSLVGPRPHQPREVKEYKKHQLVVHAIRPGITGLAQISGRSDLTFEEEIRLDTLYLEQWSFLMDIIILLKTPFVLLKRRRAL